MRFVYLHIIWFAAWVILGVEKYSYGLLMMVLGLPNHNHPTLNGRPTGYRGNRQGAQPYGSPRCWGAT